MNMPRKGFLRVFAYAVRFIEKHGIVIVGSLLVFATALWIAVKTDRSYFSFLEALYSALQFIAVNKVVDCTVSNPCIRFWLHFTQFAIPFFASVTIFSKLFHERLYPFLKRNIVNSYMGHHVIVSYGAFGKALAKALSHVEPLIVAVDKQHTAEHDNESTLTMLYYDALRADLFKEANLKYASSVYLMLPDERDNLSLLENIKKQIGSNAPCRVYLRTQSFAMQNLFMDWVGINAFKQDGMDIYVSNPYNVAARGIVNRYSPDLYAPTDKSGSVAQVVMVVGTSEMAKAMVLRFARIGTYSPKGKLQIIWAGECVTEAFSELKTLYPALDTNYDDLQYWSLDPGVSKEYFNSVLPPISLALVDQPAQQAIRNGTIAGTDDASWPSAIYVCHDSDIRNLSEARDIQAALCSKPEAVRIKSCGKKGRLILAIQNKSELGFSDHQALHAFPYHVEEQSIDKLFAETVVNDRADDLAKWYHAVYSDLKNEKAIDDAWMKMSVYWKESNRDLADHLAIKARYAGIGADTVKKLVFDGTGSLNEQDEAKMKAAFDDLVLMEMYRYRAFMFMNNFQYGTHASEYLERVINDPELDNPKKNLNYCLRINDTLLKKELPEDERKKDSNIVIKSIELLTNRLH